MNGIKLLFALFLLATAVLVQRADATTVTLLSITGPGSTGEILNADQAGAAEFTLGQSYSDVAISADLLCVGCQGDIYLMEGAIGTGATLANFVTGSTFDAYSSVNPLLSGLTLGAGDYFLVVSITTTGAGWSASMPAAATITSVSGVSAGYDFFASCTDQCVPYGSNFELWDSSAYLMFSVTANVVGNSGGASVPEPPTLILFAMGLIGLAGLHRHHRRSRRAA